MLLYLHEVFFEFEALDEDEVVLLLDHEQGLVLDLARLLLRTGIALLPVREGGSVEVHVLEPLPPPLRADNVLGVVDLSGVGCRERNAAAED